MSPTSAQAKPPFFAGCWRYACNFATEAASVTKLFWTIALALSSLQLTQSADASGTLSGQGDVAQALEAAGFHEFEERRYEIHVDNCTMTTFVFEDWEEHEKVLWSSFRFDIRFANLMDPREDGRRYIWNEAPDGSTIALTTFTMAPGATARHEMASRRNPKPPFRTSPREGVDTYIYKDKTSFFIMQEGHLSPEQPDSFTHLYERYRRDYCLPVS